MDDDLPCEYDVIVLGTGLVESVVAAASSRIGKKVLHLDKNSYYGHLWSTFTLENFEQWLSKSNKDEEVRISPEEIPKEDQFKVYETCKNDNSVNNKQWHWFISEDSGEKNEEEITSKQTEDEDEDKCDWTIKKIKKLSQKFNIDLSPKIIFSKGPMVELLIRSGVSRYTEFVSVHNVLLYLNSIIESVPYSKSDVFSSRSVSVVEKRILMKLLNEIQNFNQESLENESFKTETFSEFLKKFQISENIEKYILYSIARVSKESSCIEGIRSAQYFLNSLGVYGNSPFLWPLYGSSELVQAFCRLCAVYGGIYCLSRGAEQMIVENDICLGIISENRKLLAQHIVISSNQIPSEFLVGDKFETISRGILITDKPLYPSGKKGVSLLQYPTSDSSISPVTIIELDCSTLACPNSLYLVHMIKEGFDNDYKEFDKIVEELFEICESATNYKIDELQQEKNKPHVLFKLYFNISQKQLNPSSIKPKNVYPCTSPVQFELDFFSALQAAENIFRQMFPDEEFLPQPVESTMED